MSEKHYPHYGGNFDRIIFDRDGSVWVPDVRRREVESENASLRGAAQGLGELCDRYKAENAKLRKRLAQYELFECVVGDPSTEFARLRRDLHRLQRENAKLRELCANMWRDIPKTESCGWDMSTNTCTGSDECIGECSYWYRMRELGIEVSDG